MKKNHKPKKSGTKKRKSRKGKRGLGTTKTAAIKSRAKSMVEGLKETGKTLAGNALGFVGGALIAKGLDKIPFLQPNDADGKVKAGLKKSVKPLTLLVVGITTSTVAKKKGMHFVKSIGDGVSVAGVYVGGKTLLSKTEIFSGLGAVNQKQLADKNAEYFRENAEELRKIAEENKRALELEQPGNEKLNGEVVIPGTQLDLEGNTMLL